MSKFYYIFAVILFLIGLGVLVLINSNSVDEISLSGRFVNSEIESSKLLVDLDSYDKNIYSTALIVEEKERFVSPDDSRDLIKADEKTINNYNYTYNQIDLNILADAGSVGYVNSDGNYLTFDSDFYYLKNQNWFKLDNRFGDPFCSGSYNDYCFWNFYDETSCNSYNNCSWYPDGYCDSYVGDPVCYGNMLFDCSMNYFDESSCNNDPYAMCFWDNGACYNWASSCEDFSGWADGCDYAGCFKESCVYLPDETSCNGSVTGLCEWFDYSYCDGILSCDAQENESQCSDLTSLGCAWDTNTQYSKSEAGQLISSAADGVSPLLVDSTTKVENLNSDYLDGYDSSNFLRTSNSNLVLPSLSNGKFLKSGSSAMSWDSAVEGSLTNPYGTTPNTWKYLAAWTGTATGTTTIDTPRYIYNGGATFGILTVNGLHALMSRNDSGNAAMIAISGLTGAVSGLYDLTTFTTYAAWYYNTAAEISTLNLVKINNALNVYSVVIRDILTSNIVEAFSFKGRSSDTLFVGDLGNLGSEKLNNGTFTGSAAYWNLGSGWSYSSKRGAYHGSDGTGLLTQTDTNMISSLEVNKAYYLSFSLLFVTAGDIFVSVCDKNLTLHNSDGTKSEVFFCGDVSNPLSFVPSNNFRGYVDSVTLKEIGVSNLFVTGDTIFEGDIIVDNNIGWSGNCGYDKNLIVERGLIIGCE